MFDYEDLIEDTEVWYMMEKTRYSYDMVTDYLKAECAFNELKGQWYKTVSESAATEEEFVAKMRAGWTELDFDDYVSKNTNLSKTQIENLTEAQNEYYLIYVLGYKAESDE